MPKPIIDKQDTFWKQLYISQIHSHGSVLTKDDVSRGSPSNDGGTLLDTTTEDSGIMPYHLQIQAQDVTLINR